MANEDNEKWELPEPLRITNEQVAAQALEMVKELKPKAVSPFARLSPQEFERIRATARVSHIADDLHRVEGELRTSRGKDSVQKLREARHALAKRLAENLAITGRYDLAAQVTPDPEQQKEYAGVVRALVLDDSYKCQCAPGKKYVKTYVFSPKHQRMMPLIACSGCETMNVTTLPNDLAKQQEARAKARTMVEGMSPEEAAKTLRAAGHVTEKLIPRQ